MIGRSCTNVADQRVVAPRSSWCENVTWLDDTQVVTVRVRELLRHVLRRRVRAVAAATAPGRTELVNGGEAIRLAFP